MWPFGDTNAGNRVQREVNQALGGNNLADGRAEYKSPDMEKTSGILHDNRVHVIEGGNRPRNDVTSNDLIGESDRTIGRAENSMVDLEAAMRAAMLTQGRHSLTISSLKNTAAMVDNVAKETAKIAKGVSGLAGQ